MNARVKGTLINIVAILGVVCLFFVVDTSRQDARRRIRALESEVTSAQWYADFYKDQAEFYRTLSARWYEAYIKILQALTEIGRNLQS